jgi:hypothetical protein
MSGDAQAGTAGYLLPDTIVVALRDDTNAPIPFAPLHVSIDAVLGQVTLVDALTRADGTARIVWRLGLVLGEQQLEVSSGVDAVVVPLEVRAEARSAPMRAIGGGEEVMCGVDAGGQLGCWAPLAATAHAPQWTTYPTDQRFVAMAMHRRDSGEWRGCAAATTGRVWCFEVNHDAAIEAINELAGNHPSIVSLATGSGAVDSDPPFCGLAADGSAWCWGDNRWGVLGDATLTSRTIVAAVATPVRFHQLAVGLYHACAAATDGVGWCWGRNDFSQVGKLPSSDPITAPVRRSGTLRFTAVAPVAPDASCGVVRDNGGVYCWGAKESTGIGPVTMSRIEQPSFDFPIFTAGAGRNNSIGVVDRASIVVGSTGESAWWGRLDPRVAGILSYAPRPFVHQLPLDRLAPGHASGLVCGTSAGSDTYLCGRMMTLTGYSSHQPHPGLAGFGMPRP